MISTHDPGLCFCLSHLGWKIWPQHLPSPLLETCPTNLKSAPHQRGRMTTRNHRPWGLLSANWWSGLAQTDPTALCIAVLPLFVCRSSFFLSPSPSPFSPFLSNHFLSVLPSLSIPFSFTLPFFFLPSLSFPHSPFSFSFILPFYLFHPPFPVVSHSLTSSLWIRGHNKATVYLREGVRRMYKALSIQADLYLPCCFPPLRLAHSVESRDWTRKQTCKSVWPSYTLCAVLVQPLKPSRHSHRALTLSSLLLKRQFIPNTKSSGQP